MRPRELEGRKTNFIFPRLPSKCRMAEKPFIITVLGSGIQIINIPTAANYICCGQRVSFSPSPQPPNISSGEGGVTASEPRSRGRSKERQTFLETPPPSLGTYRKLRTVSHSRSLFLFAALCCVREIVNGLSASAPDPVSGNGRTQKEAINSDLLFKGVTF